jgi:hypothetical protein
MTYGKTIRIYLADGTPSGIRHAELVNWSGQAIVCPRGRVGELGTWAECQRPGVYVLVGDDGSSSKELAYIGEAENVFTRLQGHLKTKEFWTRVVFFTSKDENLTKAHAKYLEARLIELALEANRSLLENGNSPQRPALPRSERDAMEEFLEPIRTLLGALGFPLLQPIATRASNPSERPGALENTRLIFKPAKRNINAEGASTDDGFVVYAGAVGDREVRSHLGKGYRTTREALIVEGAIVEEAETFASPATCCSTVPPLLLPSSREEPTTGVKPGRTPPEELSRRLRRRPPT